MKKEELIIFLNHRVKITMKNSYHYTGDVKSVDEESLLLYDKFGDNIRLDLEEIAIVIDDER